MNLDTKCSGVTPTTPVVGDVRPCLPRMWNGVYQEVRKLPYPERLEPRTRTIARIGSMISERQMAKIRAAEPALAARVQSIFDDFDGF